MGRWFSDPKEYFPTPNVVSIFFAENIRVEGSGMVLLPIDLGYTLSEDFLGALDGYHAYRGLAFSLGFSMIPAR